MPERSSHPADVPVASPDVDASVAFYGSLLGGDYAAAAGSSPVQPFDVEGVGRIAVLADPNGTHFSIIVPPGDSG